MLSVDVVHAHATICTVAVDVVLLLLLLLQCLPPDEQLLLPLLLIKATAAAAAGPWTGPTAAAAQGRHAASPHIANYSVKCCSVNAIGSEDGQGIFPAEGDLPLSRHGADLPQQPFRAAKSIAGVLCITHLHACDCQINVITLTQFQDGAVAVPGVCVVVPCSKLTCVAG